MAPHQLLALVLLLAAATNAKFKMVLFYEPNDGLFQEVPFKYAVSHFNSLHLHEFEAVMEDAKDLSPFQITAKACQLAEDGAVAFFGPSNPSLAGTVASVAKNLEIPHLLGTWKPDLPQGGVSANLYPDADVLSQALADVVRSLSWRSYSIVVEDEVNALVRLQGVLQARDPVQMPIIIRKLSPDGDDRPMLKQMKQNAEMRVVLDCSPERIVSLLRQMAALDMLDVYHSIFLANLDAHTQNLSEFRVTNVNITTVRLVDPSSRAFENAYRYWDNSEQMHYASRFPLPAEAVKTETVLVYDAARLYYHSLTRLNTTHAEQLMNAPPTDCRNASHTYAPGLLLADFIKGMEEDGVTGTLRLDGAGRRTDFRLQVVELTMKGFNGTGEWRSPAASQGVPLRPGGGPGPGVVTVGAAGGPSGYTSTRSSSDLDTQITESLQSKLIIVTSRIGEPFLRFKEPRDPSARGNDQFEGYSIDLIRSIAEILNMTFEFRLVPDKQYGSYDPKTQKWNGLLGELLERRADLAICDLTITYVREQAVDFTMPFMNLGISILYKKSEKAETNLFSFLEPFSIDVWIYMMTAYLGVSLLLFVLARANPHEWDSAHPCQSDPDELENNFNMVNCLWFSLGSLMGQGCDILPRASPYEWEGGGPHDPNPSTLSNNFTLLNSLWFTIGSLMQQGSDILPKAVSTRMVAGMWWFFTLIMISSYTANLAAFLTVTRMDDTIKNVEDLAKQTKIKYGTYQSGSTAAFFRESNNSLYQRMWTVMMQARPNVFTSGNKEGVDRVKKGKGDYAFFMESTSIEYEIRKNCDLIKVGGQLDSKGYGIALPPGSPYRKMINGAILNLQESGMLKILKDRWWRERVPNSCDASADAEKTADSAELDLSNVGGVFLVLVFGCIAAFIVSVLEFLWNSRKIAVEEKVTPWEAMVKELRFAVDCRADSKPVRRSSSSSSKEGSGEADANGGSFMQLQMNYDGYGVDPPH